MRERGRHEREGRRDDEGRRVPRDARPRGSPTGSGCRSCARSSARVCSHCPHTRTPGRITSAQPIALGNRRSGRGLETGPGQRSHKHGTIRTGAGRQRHRCRGEQLQRSGAPVVEDGADGLGEPRDPRHRFHGSPIRSQRPSAPHHAPDHSRGHAARVRGREPAAPRPRRTRPDRGRAGSRLAPTRTGASRADLPLEVETDRDAHTDLGPVARGKGIGRAVERDPERLERDPPVLAGRLADQLRPQPVGAHLEHRRRGAVPERRGHAPRRARSPDRRGRPSTSTDRPRGAGARSHRSTARRRLAKSTPHASSGLGDRHSHTLARAWTRRDRPGARTRSTSTACACTRSTGSPSRRAGSTSAASSSSTVSARTRSRGHPSGSPSPTASARPSPPSTSIGFGRTRAPERAATIATNRDARRGACSTQLGPAVVIGNSMGAVIAPGVAARRPDLVEALVLVEPGAAVGPHRAGRLVARRRGYAPLMVPSVGRRTVSRAGPDARPRAARRPDARAVASHDPTRLDPDLRAPARAPRRRALRLPRGAGGLRRRRPVAPP